MAADKFDTRPYSWEEFISFDRLKRAVRSRVLDTIEHLIETEFPIEPARVEKLTEEEWELAKQTLRTSPQAREAYRKWLEGAVDAHLDRRMKSDKTELEQFGVQEKAL